MRCQVKVRISLQMKITLYQSTSLNFCTSSIIVRAWRKSASTQINQQPPARVEYCTATIIADGNIVFEFPPQFLTRSSVKVLCSPLLFASINSGAQVYVHVDSALHAASPSNEEKHSRHAHTTGTPFRLYTFSFVSTVAFVLYVQLQLQLP